MFLDNGDETKSDAKRRAYVLQAYFGARCEVHTLTENDVRAYTTKRLAGGIKCDDGFITKVVRMRSVECDFKLLVAALRWATTVRLSTGRRWLDHQPLDGVKIPRERNPLRPMASIERFQQTREAIQQLAAEAATEDLRLRWFRVELALVLIEATGRRRGAVLHLAWDDIDFERQTIRWRAEGDKQRREWVIPMPVTLADELRASRRKLGAVGGWLFPSERDASQPTHPDVLSAWIEQAERKAKLPKLRGGLLHPYRRKWATERKHLSVKDVAAAGGWQDVTTLLTFYQQPDLDTMLAVMSEPRKVTESVAVRR
jgi:integrase